MLYKAPSLQTSVYIQVCVRVLQPLHSLVWSIYIRSCYMYIVAILVGIGVSLLLPVSVVVHTHSSRMIQVQVQMADRALELLGLPDDQPSYILDVG